ncbi:M23 family metallopeptidase [Sphingomonas sp. SUN019]|uniref:M23 family metallopeptidase n=1 Tax=Sphingomonas sp. SUN019 TaxID=2937788 RepID=UPI0021648F3D|nr:M23 family metallopeptidase [Sphingomonas sp. SUN019]UVO51645.1 M23 family metallopeptidase [Sphingomonas sp. SUN019]
MTNLSNTPVARLTERARSIFTARDLIFHDGRTLRRFRVGGAVQGVTAGTAAAVLLLAGYGAAQASTEAATAAGIVAPAVSEARLKQMERKVASMQARVATIRQTAQAHADRIEQRQALIAAAMTGKGDAKKLALATLAIDPVADRVAAHAIAPLKKVEARQVALAAAAEEMLDRRYAMATKQIRKLGLRPDRVVRRLPVGAMGGPLIPASSAEATADLSADQQFRSLFMTWKKLDTLEQGVISIPSVQPVQHLTFTSNFGIRSDPFRGTAAMHAGVDIPGPSGTPIYATADGIVSHADRQGGYGNMIEVNHGKGISTRYGHLSKIMVTANGRVRRGQMIGLMGSTGRSTGPHLHYEVRIDGHAVNPVPFLTTADYLLASKDQAVGQIPVAAGGPAAQD